MKIENLISRVSKTENKIKEVKKLDEESEIKDFSLNLTSGKKKRRRLGTKIEEENDDENNINKNRNFFD